LTDFREVLRKKHAGDAAWLCARRKIDAPQPEKITKQYQYLIASAMEQRATR
jgi:hypothetical protein